MADLKIGDEVYIHGYIDEIRKDTVIIKNEGGYFGTVTEEIIPSAQPERIIYANMSDEEFEKWLYEHGICNPDIHDSIPCSAVPLLIDNAISKVPSAQPEVIRCKDCIYYDPPHVENNGVRYEYDEIQADAFDALGTGLVTAEYGINIGGRCCVDYYCKNYSDDKRVFVREDNYCGRAERRTDEE